MARYKITTEDGKSYAITTEDSPIQETQQPFSEANVMGNALRETKDQARGFYELGATSFPPFAAAKQISGENPYGAERNLALTKGIYEGIKSVPSSVVNTVKHPIRSFQERPGETVQNLDLLASLGLSGANLISRAAGAASRKTLPSLLKAGGVPEKLTETVLDNPSVLRQPPAPENIVNEVVGRPVQQAMQGLKERTGKSVRNVFQKYAGMEGPVQEIQEAPRYQKITPQYEQVPVAQKLVRKEPPTTSLGVPMGKTRLEPGEMMTERKITSYKPGAEGKVLRGGKTYEEILLHKDWADEAFRKGDDGYLKKLYREYVNPEAPNDVVISDKNRNEILTRMKREVQQQTKFNLAPITNAPIDSAKDAAFKSIASDLSSLRSDLPGGERLAVADQAWKEIHDLYDIVQKDLADPGKAKDLFMKIAKGDQTWATSGRMQTKLNTIKKLEGSVGKELVKPAMEELSRQIFSQWYGKGFIPNVLRAGIAGAVTLNPGLFLKGLFGIAMTSPKVVGKGIMAGQSAGRAISGLAPRASMLGAKASIPVGRQVLLNARKRGEK